MGVCEVRGGLGWVESLELRVYGLRMFGNNIGA